MPRKKRNRAQCLKCGDIIESKDGQDFVKCKCGALAVDGGSEYTRRLGDKMFIKEMPYDQ